MPVSHPISATQIMMTLPCLTHTAHFQAWLSAYVHAEHRPPTREELDIVADTLLPTQNELLNAEDQRRTGLPVIGLHKEHHGLGSAATLNAYRRVFDDLQSVSVAMVSA